MAHEHQEYDAMIDTLRKQAINDEEVQSKKQRFALFSQPPSLSTGDDTQYRKILHPRNENGKPITEPKNMSISAPRQGKIKDSYFSVLGFVTIGDLYQDVESINRKQELVKKKLIRHEQAFRPASGYRNIHQTEDTHKSISHIDAEGKVITLPPNIKTNPENKLLLKSLPYMSEPYDRQRQLKIKELEEHHKIMGEKVAFRTAGYGNKNFNNVRTVFGEEGLNLKRRPHSVTRYNIVKHDAPFRPSNPNKSGIAGTIDKFPEYKSDPLRLVVRVNKSKDKEAFRQKHCGDLTRPTPTISCNPINIRRDIQSRRINY